MLKTFFPFVCSLFFCSQLYAVTSIAPCVPVNSNLRADYIVKKNNISKQLQLWRSVDTVIQKLQQDKISKLWQLQSNQQLAHTIIFEHYQRGISFDSIDLQLSQQNANWQQVSQLVTQQQLDILHKTHTRASTIKGLECFQESIYESKSDIDQIKIAWIPQLKLATYIKHTHLNIQPKHSVHSHLHSAKILTTTDEYRLQNISILPVVALQREVLRFETMDLVDFSDIGDREADPFIHQVSRYWIKHQH